MGYTACIVAAGRGARVGGDTPKQFRMLAGRPMLAWSIDRFVQHPQCDAVIIAHAPGRDAVVRACCTDHKTVLVRGGKTRTGSVRQALQTVRSEQVLIHDAARPMLSQALIDRLLAALQDQPGAAPALLIADALVRQTPAGVTSVNRDNLFRIQTPQAFHTAALKKAFETTNTVYPDEVSLARASGMTVALVKGEETNFKVTYPDDLARAQTLLGAPEIPLTVTGTGYDVHRLDIGEGVHLCGVFIACGLRLIGHSDADAGLHALTDALLGAAGLGDIGEHFPPSDDRWKGAASALFLRHALELSRRAGITPVHADVTLICEKPAIGSHKPAMRTRVAELLGLEEARVNIKATTTEKLGFTGRGEGLAAQAIVTAMIV